MPQLEKHFRFKTNIKKFHMIICFLSHFRFSTEAKVLSLVSYSDWTVADQKEDLNRF